MEEDWNVLGLQNTSNKKWKIPSRNFRSAPYAKKIGNICFHVKNKGDSLSR